MNVNERLREFSWIEKAMLRHEHHNQLCRIHALMKMEGLLGILIKPFYLSHFQLASPHVMWCFASVGNMNHITLLRNHIILSIQHSSCIHTVLMMHIRLVRFRPSKHILLFVCASIKHQGCISAPRCFTFFSDEIYLEKIYLVFTVVCAWWEFYPVTLLLDSWFTPYRSLFSPRTLCWAHLIYLIGCS